MAPGTVAVEATQSAANPVVSSPVGGNAGGDTGADSGGGVYEGSSGSSRSGGESGESYAGDGAREGASDASREPLSADDFDSLEDYAQALIEQRQNRADKDGEDQDWEGEGPDSEGLEDESPESEEPEGEEAEQQTADDEFESSLDRDEGRPGLELEEDDYFNPKLLNEKINASPELRAALEKSPELRNAMFRNARLASETSRYKELFPDVESARYAAETSATFRQLDDLFLNATTPEGTGRFLQKWAEMSLAISAMESAPLTGLILPSRESSPVNKYPSRTVCSINPSDAMIPTAIGRSNAEPSFLRSAGARLTVICFRGKLKPIFFKEALTLSRLSFTAASGRPTIEKCGSPREEISTSTSTLKASIPITLALSTFESIKPSPCLP